MNTCMNAHATREEEDKAREEWFEKIPERRAEKAEEERKKEEMRRKHREWWGLDEQGRRLPEGDPRLKGAGGRGGGGVEVGGGRT